MSSPFFDPARAVASAVDEYRQHHNLGVLFDRLHAVASTGDPESLKAAARPYHEMPEVVIPLYEVVVRDAPNDAQAMVILANAYWLTGRGPDVVGQLADRARAADPDNRGAWHLWALAESSVRQRMERWLEVSRRFPAAQLARAALADNATSVAHDESDPVALKLAIATYESLLREAATPEQRAAIEASLAALRNWGA
jgi:hypothetical protein